MAEKNKSYGKESPEEVFSKEERSSIPQKLQADPKLVEKNKEARDNLSQEEKDKYDKELLSLSKRLYFRHCDDVFGYCEDEDYADLSPEDAVKLIEDLLSKGADPNAKEHAKNYCSTLLECAVHINLNEAVEILLKYGADPNNGTLLHDAIRSYSLKIVELLLKYGADPNIDHPNIDLPLHLVMRHDSAEMPEIVELLLKYGADPNSKDSKNHTPLFNALKVGSTDYVGSLIRHGAATNSIPLISYSVKENLEKKLERIKYSIRELEEALRDISEA